MTNESCRGVWVPVATPFDAEGSVSHAPFIAHCKSLLQQGVDGLAILGTTSEANSLSVHERIDLIHVLVDSGVEPSRLMPGTGSCAIVDAVKLTAAAVDAGCSGVLVLPPFFYKGGVTDDSLFGFFSELIERVGTDDLRVFLYHIPPVAQIGISAGLIEKLLKIYPKVVAGYKDSSGDYRNTASIIREFPSLNVFPGSEAFLLQGLRDGGAGCITATGNINAAAISELYDGWESSLADAMQIAVSLRRKIVEGFSLIPAVKAVLASQYRHPLWRKMRSPLMALDDASYEALVEALNSDGLDLEVVREGSNALA